MTFIKKGGQNFMKTNFVFAIVTFNGWIKVQNE